MNAGLPTPEIAMDGTAIVVTSKTHAIVAEINQEHELARSAAESAVEHAIRCGQLLFEQKQRLEHGEFQAWIKVHCEFAYTTAARYMTAARQKSTGVDISSLSRLFPSGQKKRSRLVPVVKPVLPKIDNREARDHRRDPAPVPPGETATATQISAAVIDTDITKTTGSPAASISIEQALKILREAAFSRDSGESGSKFTRLVRTVQIWRGQITTLENKLRAAKEKLAEAQAAAIDAAAELSCQDQP